MPISDSLHDALVLVSFVGGVACLAMCCDAGLPSCETVLRWGAVGVLVLAVDESV